MLLRMKHSCRKKHILFFLIHNYSDTTQCRRSDTIFCLGQIIALGVCYKKWRKHTHLRVRHSGRGNLTKNKTVKIKHINVHYFFSLILLLWRKNNVLRIEKRQKCSPFLMHVAVFLDEITIMNVPRDNVKH